MNRFLGLALAAAALLTGCTCGTSGGTNTGKVRGVVVGRITDSLTGAVIANVSIKLHADTLITASSDSEGNFIVRDLPVGALLVSFEAPGYVRMLCNPFIDTSTVDEGNVLGRCDMVMAKAEAKLEGFVVTPDGKPVGGLELSADLRALSSGQQFAGYDLVVNATTAADGSFAFAALPAVPRGVGVNVYFPPHDANGDGEPEVAGFTRFFSVFPGPSAAVVVVLSSSVPEIVVSNISDNELAPGEAASVTFSTPLDTANALVTLVDATRNVEIPLEETWASGITLSAKPAAGNQLAVGHRYQLNIVAKSVGTNNVFGNAWNLNFVVRAGSVNPIASQVSGLAVTSPLNPAHSTTSYVLAFTGAAGAAGYKVYGKDTLNNPDWRLITAFQGSSTGTVFQAFLLPGEFDAFFYDGAQWPLAGGNRLTFAVVPFDSYGNESPLSAAATVQVQDTAPPSWVSIGTQVGDAVNDTSQPARVILPITFSEPMKSSVVPQLVTASSLAAQWTWANDYQSGFFTVNIPANSNGAEGFLVRGGEDQNGNKVGNGEPAYRFLGIQDFLTNTGFEDGSCSLQGWVGSATGGPPTIGAPAAQGGTYSTSLNPTSRCAAAIGSINGSAPGVGTSRLSQQFTVPGVLPAGRGVVMRASARYASDASPVSASGNVRCVIMDQTFTTVVATLFSNVGSTATTTFGSTGLLGVALTPATTYQLVCEATLAGANPSEFGIWVDDVQVGVSFN
jgi:Carboxypeptidase regulatory-like domain